MPPLLTSGAPALGNALKFLEQMIQRGFKRPTSGYASWWKPWVFIFFEGTSVDEYMEIATKMREEHVAAIVGIGVDEFDLAQLRHITDSVVLLDDCQSTKFEQFDKLFVWVD